MKKLCCAVLALLPALALADVLPIDDSGLSNVTGLNSMGIFTRKTTETDGKKADEEKDELRGSLRTASQSIEQNNKDVKPIDQLPTWDVARDGWKDVLPNQNADNSNSARGSLGPGSFSPTLGPNIDYSGTRSRVLINR